MNDYYEVIPVSKPIDCEVEVPGSKSITNRALLLASMARGKSILTNVLFSDDSRGFMDCLRALGYDIRIDEAEKRVELSGGIPCENGRINVRSAGTAARFITAMLAAYQGEYTIESSGQMKLRPMKPLLDALISLGCEIECLEREGFLPFVLRGGRLRGGEVMLDCGQSSQFLSALLMTGCLHENDLVIRTAGRETARSYVDITLKMMAQFGVPAQKADGGTYVVGSGQAYVPGTYNIEPDLSSACYFYAAAALTGGSVLVRGVHESSMQGDIRYLDILKKIGCSMRETADGIRLKGPAQGKYAGIDVDMSDCSDQSLTLAVLAPFAASPTTIRNIQHIKYQESNRVHAVLTELSKMGIKCSETADGIVIYPGAPKASLVETYNDHRIAMAFSLIGLRAEGVRISDPLCVSKTFEDYFKVFDQLRGNPNEHLGQ